MDEYESLAVYDGSGGAPERFEQCRAYVSPHRVLIVMAGKECHTWNADSWKKVEGVPLVRI